MNYATWTTRDGSEILLSEMTLEHLINALTYLLPPLVSGRVTFSSRRPVLERVKTVLEELEYRLREEETQLKLEEVLRNRPKIKQETNSTVDNRIRRKDLGCSFCPPNKGENAKRKAKHGNKKPKKKDRRK